MRRVYSLKNQCDLQLSQNFKVKEFACKDGSDTVEIDTELVEALQRLRDLSHCPITIVSGYRTQSYNEKCGGAKNSYHMKGMAADIVVKGITDITTLIFYAVLAGFRGIGIYPNFLHCDVRTEPYKWEVK